LLHSIRVVAGKYDNKEDKGDVNHFKDLTSPTWLPCCCYRVWWWKKPSIILMRWRK